MNMTGPIDLILLGGRIKTMDEQRPFAEAIAVSGNRIVAVGTDVEVAALVQARTRIVNANGGTVLPGFNDAHVHIFSGSASLVQLSLEGVQGFENLKSAIAGYAAAHPDAPSIVAQGCLYTAISPAEPITRHHLDQIMEDRPLLLVAFDLHTAWANTVALQHAGVLGGRKLPLGNEIVMGKDGLATGELREADAISPVHALFEGGGREMLGISTGDEPHHVTEADRDYDISLLRHGLAHCASQGITSIQNMDGNLYQLELLNEIQQTEGLPVRVRMPFHMKNFTPLSDLREKAAAWNRLYDSDMLRCDFVKLFMDGVTESETAFFLEDYAHQPGWKGEALFSQMQFDDICATASRLNLQVASHAVGDGAVRRVLNGYEHASDVTGARDLRHRVEHIEVIHPDDIDRFCKIGAVASMQPIHAPSRAEADADAETAPRLIGPARLPHAFAWRKLADAGAPMVFSTDWPVAPLDPMLSISAAMTREPIAEGVPDQRLPLDDILRGYTLNAAWVEFMSDRKGMVREGYLADLVVLDADIDVVAPEALSTVCITLTICDGRITFERTSRTRGAAAAGLHHV
ncbi:amidohydrolase [Rhizobium rhizogenes]|jgi:predicted amidohydrolase YtcJ|uniref:amidohydrolase n=1 Tax=Rhizobium rhizogenes TaxID=359 RepID=UPI001571CD56|nr:amidohydrolase [Rhizobium rhizogenes]